MAPRRVVADSDDDDDEDDTFSPVKFPHLTERPEPEPLSPSRQPSSPGSVDELAIAPVFDGRSGSSNRISDKTDTSFFASIYDEQQKGVLQQSHLIENIVRQSQKASTSSGDVSLSGKGKGKSKNKAQNLSSVTDITSPIVLDKLVNHQSMFSDDATQLTTPRKSAQGDMWDVPSSVDSSKGKKRGLTTYSKRKRSNSVLTTGSTGAAMFGSDDAGVQDGTEHAVADVAADDGCHDDDDFVKPSPVPATKKPKVSLYDATAAQNSTTFYIAQSNLTTMQKLEYQKVSVPGNPYNGVPGSTAHQNSTCASTIAYSTPSLYASSGPPLPWERTAAEPEAEPEQPETSQHVIDITSSPDVMVSGHERPETRKTKSTSVAEATPNAVGDPLPGLDETLTSRKRHNNPKRIEEVDELGQDEAWDSDTIGYHHETYRPRPSRRRSNATSTHESEAVQHEEVEDPVNVVDLGVEEEARTATVEPVVDPIEQTFASEAPHTASEIYEAVQRDQVPTTQPKKRGRKKKQPVVEETIEGERPTEEPTAPAELDPPVQATEVEEVADKPKRKRGRPRKSDLPKPAEITAPSGPINPPEEPARKAANDHNEVSPEKVAKEYKSKKTAKKPKERDNVDSDVPTEDESSALKEKDANSRIPARSVSSEPAGKKPKEAPAATAIAENKQGKSQAKEPPKPVASQSKAPYRVGLSKKTRIAPLLKIIKK